MFDWDDLKHFLAVAQYGSTSAAGRAEQVDQSTVQRRLTELERRIGQPLVERHPGGTRLTAYGQQLLPLARRVEHDMLALEQFIQSSARALSGTVRLTCPEPIVVRITRSPLLDRLRARHPGLHIEFVIRDQYVDLGKGEADVALRSGDTTDNRLVGRKIADSLWAVYASLDYLARHPAPAGVGMGPRVGVADLVQHAWVGFDQTMAHHRASQWLRQAVPGARIVATASSVLGALQSAKAGLGLAALPTGLGDAEPDLVQVLGPVPEMARIWRLLTTRQLRRTPRVSAFFEFMADEIATLKPVLTG